MIFVRVVLRPSSTAHVSNKCTRDSENQFFLWKRSFTNARAAAGSGPPEVRSAEVREEKKADTFVFGKTDGKINCRRFFAEDVDEVEEEDDVLRIGCGGVVYVLISEKGFAESVRR